jgi:hypothetical protein
MNIYFIISGGFIVVFFCILVCVFFFSPKGVEDEKGFHIIEEGKNPEEYEIIGKDETQETTKPDDYGS